MNGLEGVDFLECIHEHFWSQFEENPIGRRSVLDLFLRNLVMGMSVGEHFIVTIKVAMSW